MTLAATADIDSYFVTELLGTDLHRLLTSRPLEKQFIQYFLYQILVWPPSKPFNSIGLMALARSKICTLSRSSPPRPKA